MTGKTHASPMTQHQPDQDQPGQDQPGQARPSRRRASRLIDIAEAVGVHTSTVSRVLNGDPAQSVRPEVYEKIWRTARQQGYRPNALARALKRRRTGALAFVIPLLRNPIWVRLQRGALQPASERGYVVMIMEEPGDDPQPRPATATWSRRAARTACCWPRRCGSRRTATAGRWAGSPRCRTCT